MSSGRCRSSGRTALSSSAATGQDSIPVLVADGEVLAGEEAIVSYLNTHFAQPPEAEHQRAKAAKAKRKELEKACLELAAATR